MEPQSLQKENMSSFSFFPKDLFSVSPLQKKRKMGMQRQVFYLIVTPGKEAGGGGGGGMKKISVFSFSVLERITSVTS